MNQTGKGAAYRERARSRAKTQEVTLPSGEVFILRPPNLEMFAISGALPSSIAEKMESAKGKGLSDEESFQALTGEEKEKSFAFGRRLLIHICVDPKIVSDPTADNEIAIEDLEPEDLAFLMDYAKSGGGSAEAGSFRPQSDALASSSRKK